MLINNDNFIFDFFIINLINKFKNSNIWEQIFLEYQSTIKMKVRFFQYLIYIILSFFN